MNATDMTILSVASWILVVSAVFAGITRIFLCIARRMHRRYYPWDVGSIQLPCHHHVIVEWDANEVEKTCYCAHPTHPYLTYTIQRGPNR